MKHPSSDYKPVGKALTEMFKAMGTLPTSSYEVKPIAILDINLPIKRMGPAFIPICIKEYIMRRCDGDLSLARGDRRLWMGHVISKTIPGVEKLVTALGQGGYLYRFTEAVVYTSIYQAVIEVNPGLHFDDIQWSKWEPKLKPFQISIAKKTKAALSLLRMRWGDDVNTADDVHLYLTKAMEALDEYLDVPKP
jgi:hypothetical protein